MSCHCAYAYILIYIYIYKYIYICVCVCTVDIHTIVVVLSASISSQIRAVACTYCHLLGCLHVEHARFWASLGAQHGSASSQSHSVGSCSYCRLSGSFRFLQKTGKWRCSSLARTVVTVSSHSEAHFPNHLSTPIFAKGMSTLARWLQCFCCPSFAWKWNQRST